MISGHFECKSIQKFQGLKTGLELMHPGLCCGLVVKEGQRRDIAGHSIREEVAGGMVN